VAGILQAYQQAINSVKLYGPTNFTPILQAVMQMANQYVDQNNQKYFIFLIITDGEITDMDQTLTSIIQMSNLPISVVIVGVGPASFDKMTTLDGDDGHLQHRGKTASRDVVQFVPFRDFAGNHARLTKETLAEIPKQLTSFMKTRGIVPNPPIQAGQVVPTEAQPQVFLGPDGQPMQVAQATPIN